MSLSAPTPPLLLTKRLTGFLRSNLSPQIHTALLTTLSGKLLAHASAHPVSTLRTQCTVAASVWSIYSSGPPANDALPQSAARGSRNGTENKPTAVTIQLSAGVLVVRKLRCGLLFVCIGPAPDGTSAPASDQSQSHAQGAPQQSLAVPGSQQSQPGAAGDTHSSPPLGSPSEVASVASAAPTMNSVATTGTVTTGAVVLMRRQAEDLARWLDDKLGTLGIPDEES
ncbi:hypothetical protein BKA67DRAFT_539470 [Truncatella angustata]|uniref:Uncharacterized protein n=1 Tax=Truncatella angustata TaxID=152316 RepID=A0A9P8RKA1_9PEZI|nr:uncharacterized protein BKA67DRAFT_539470 [Truncatella angustata]KAH6647620.1 hypothetical protein BKA67DRAFT_539470 [Truncatella angustata]KAH8204350.1 hypothetical protein TruAng_001513 [Truncatella angustata]